MQVFEVKAKGDSASDAAYTTDDLLLHLDQNYYECSPGIQILFCLELVYIIVQAYHYTV